MSAEENKALVRRFLEEVINQRNVSAVDALTAADIMDHALAPGLPPGREGVKQNFSLFLAAFPDLRIDLADVIGEENQVAVRMTLHGTHNGVFFGIAPTSKRVAVTGIHIYRIADGTIVEHWANNDDLGLLQQLGVIPPPGQATS